jgi:hypothetical protein
MSGPSWARGYQISFLKDLAGLFKDDFKPHSYGQFGIPNERDIATALHDKNIAWSKDSLSLRPNAVAIFRKTKAGSSQSDFAQRSISIRRGDLQIRSIAGDPTALDLLLRKLLTRAGKIPTWMEVHVEHKFHSNLPTALGFEYVTTKIAASSDLKALWLANASVSARVSSDLHPADIPSLRKLSVEPPEDLLARALTEINEYGPRWAQHYSSYNKRQSWTAIALRGFDPNNPGFIIKPSEMSKKWKAENPERLRAHCQPTEASDHLPAVLELAKLIPGSPERIRLMKLSAGKGELTRHADITDRDAGTASGRISRFHIPLQTAPDCVFSGWNLDGTRERRHFPVGTSFYLDIRKPHAVKNTATVERIHLVVDVACDKNTRSLIA